MLAISSRVLGTLRPAPGVATPLLSTTTLATTNFAPACRTRHATQPPASWPSTQFRSYYFDAAHHTALTLKELLRVARPGSDALGLRSNSELMRDAMQSMVDSLCPRMDDDYESRTYFNELLSMHLSGLSTSELQALSSFLKAAGFEGVATEPVWTDAVYEDFGFSNGPLSKSQRTLMLPQDWKHLLDHVTDEVAASEKKLTTGSFPNPAESRFARHTLAHAVQHWHAAGPSMTTMAEICDDLCGALGLADGPVAVVAVRQRSRASLVDWTGDRLAFDDRVLEALKNDADGRLFAELLRDVLEAVMARRMFGEHGHPLRLSPANLMLLHRAIDEVAAQPPSVPSAAMCDAASRLLAQAGRFGKVQVMPLTGVALGHVWIGHTLSVVPDRTRASTEIGTRYIRPGGRLHPEECSVREWPIRWLTPRENDDLYPQAHAWHITVPVPALSLQKSAASVAQQWKDRNQPYRFIGTEPGTQSSGCRASVMQAVVEGMDAEARALFIHFNTGLAEPDSPTEVALRMNRFMQWLRQLASVTAVS